MVRSKSKASPAAKIRAGSSSEPNAEYSGAYQLAASEAAMQTPNVEEIQSYLYGVTLSAEQRESTWDYNRPDDDDLEDADNDKDVVKHILRLRQVTLGTTAKEDQRNIVEVRAAAANNKIISKPIASLCVGVQEMACLCLDFDNAVPVGLKLVSGSGPVHITGIHEMILEYPIDTSDGPDEESYDKLVTQPAKKMKMDETEKQLKAEVSSKKESKAEEEEMEEDEDDDDDDDEEEDEEIEFKSPGTRSKIKTSKGSTPIFKSPKDVPNPSPLFKSPKDVAGLKMMAKKLKQKQKKNK